MFNCYLAQLIKQTSLESHVYNKSTISKSNGGEITHDAKNIFEYSKSKTQNKHKTKIN